MELSSFRTLTLAHSVSPGKLAPACPPIRPVRSRSGPESETAVRGHGINSPVPQLAADPGSVAIQLFLAQIGGRIARMGEGRQLREWAKRRRPTSFSRKSG